MLLCKEFYYLNRNDLVGDNLEAICVEVLKPSSASFIVGTIYRPPSAFVDSFSNIEQLIKLIDDENKEFYLLGDLNAMNSVLDIEQNLNQDLENVNEWLIANKLTLNHSKTKFMLIGSRQRIRTFETSPTLEIGEMPINRLSHTKLVCILLRI